MFYQKRTYNQEEIFKKSDFFREQGLKKQESDEKIAFTYYIYDHLGNTRVTYSPKVTDCGNPIMDTVFTYVGDSCWNDTLWDNGIYVSHTTECDSLFTYSLYNSNRALTYTIENAFDYFPYGKLLRKYIASEEKYLTTHHERDEETGWDYRNARYSEGDIPRFGQIDPAFSMYPSMSPYSYVGGNPINATDPTGMNIDWVQNNETKEYEWKDDVNKEEDTPDGYEYIGESIKDVRKHHAENTPWYDLSGPNIKYNNWPGEISQHENNLAEEAQEVIEDMPPVAKQVAEFGYNTVDNAYIAFGQSGNVRTNMVGNLVSGDQRINAGVSTMTTLFPSNFALNYGIKGVNIAQFNQAVKGTFLSPLSPQTKGLMLRAYNYLIYKPQRSRVKAGVGVGAGAASGATQ